MAEDTEELDPAAADSEPEDSRREGLSRRSVFKRGAGMAAVGGVTPLILAACGGGGSVKPGTSVAQTTNGSPATGTDAGQTTSDYDATQGVDPKSVGKKTIGVIPIVLAAEPSKRIVAGVQKEAKKAGWKVLLTDPNGDINKAAAAWQNYLGSGVDGLVTSAFAPKLWGPQIKAAEAKKTPYVSLFSTWAPGVTAVITADVAVEGAALGTFVIDYTGGEGGVVAFSSKVTPALNTRWLAFQANVTANSSMKVLNYHELDLSKIQQDVYGTMQALLQKYPKGQIAAVFGGFIGAAVPAAQACKQAGRTEIVCVGTDGDKSGLDAIRRGNDPFKATTGLNFEAVGANAVRQLAAVMSGKQPLGKQLYQGSPVVVASNVGDSGYFAASPRLTTYSPYPA